MAISSLTLVGVGPGDPSLMTLSAVQAIQEATVVAYPVSKQGADGIAVNIAAAWITEEKKRLPLLFPMVEASSPRKQAWQLASEKLVSLVAKGEQVAFLCQGDVSLFASSSYLLLYIKANYPTCSIALIPGINSFSAAAALGHLPLALQKDQLLVLPTPDRSEDLEELL